MPVRLTVKEAWQLAEHIEANGGDASRIKALLPDTAGVDKADIDDTELIAEKRGQSYTEEGENLECAVCHTLCALLIAGVCEPCFESWVLSTRKE
jgi:hypothetical protein